jgi:hypothetical protein
VGKRLEDEAPLKAKPNMLVKEKEKDKEKREVKNKKNKGCCSKRI